MNKGKPGNISIGWFVAAAIILLVVGIAGFVYLLFTGIAGIGEELITITAPGRYDVSLSQKGTYTVFREFRNAENSGQAELPGNFRLTLQVTGPGGEDIQARLTSANQTYNISGRSGVSIMEFTVQTPGEYKIEASLGNDHPDASMTLTVIQGFLNKILVTIAKSGGVLLAGLLGCALVVVAAVVLRKPQKKGPPPLVPPPIE